MGDIRCFQCGECCRTLKSVKITREEYGILLRYGDPDIIELSDGKLEMSLPCVFLEDNMCTVYDVRPCMCRMWHCGRLAPGAPIIEWISEVQKLIATNEDYARFKTKMEDEAVIWGNRHGWNWRKD